MIFEKFFNTIKKDVCNEINRNPSDSLEVVVSFTVKDKNSDDILLQGKRRIIVDTEEDKKEETNQVETIQNEFNFDK
jgi:2-oxo-4-hydroxy-4-carboxy--5-ureidoimidazoline (OHCU) decarboxylase